MVIAGLLQTFWFYLKYYFQYKVGYLHMLFTLLSMLYWIKAGMSIPLWLLLFLVYFQKWVCFLRQLYEHCTVMGTKPTLAAYPGVRLAALIWYANGHRGKWYYPFPGKYLRKNICWSTVWTSWRLFRTLGTESSVGFPAMFVTTCESTAFRSERPRQDGVVTC